MSASPQVSCLGAGRMGRGIAHCAAYSGYSVCLIDVKPRSDAAFETLEREALGEIEAGLRMVADLGGFDAGVIPQLMERVSIVPLAKAGGALAASELVFEAVPEVIDAKKDAFALFDRHASADAILASTTSTILSTELARLTVSPERFLNAHWLNPAFLVPLVEISPADETSTATLERTTAVLEAMGKVPVVCKASPGYIVPRIQALAMNEAARLVEEGVASAEDVDKAVKYGFGMRFAVLGLLEFIDWGGGDILFYASRYLSSALETDRFQAPDIIGKNMETNRIGMKSGSGFYDYREKDTEAYRKDRLGAFMKLINDAGLAKEPKL